VPVNLVANAKAAARALQPATLAPPPAAELLHAPEPVTLQDFASRPLGAIGAIAARAAQVAGEFSRTGIMGALGARKKDGAIDHWSDVALAAAYHLPVPCVGLPLQLTAVAGYQFGSYSINTYLAGADKPSPKRRAELDRAIARLDDAMAQLPGTPGKMTVYRGQTFDRTKPFPGEMEVGARFSMPTFLSTSRSEDVAKRFGGYSSASRTAVVFHIALDEGQRGIFMPAATGVLDLVFQEREFVMPRGTEFEITKIEEDESRYGGAIHHVHVKPIR